MKPERAREILETERECVERNDGTNCDRVCANCDLLLPAEEILKAYDTAIEYCREKEVMIRG